MVEVKDTTLRKGSIRELEEEFSKIIRILRRLDLQNMDFEVVNATTPGTADTEFSVSHNLGRVPEMFIANFEAAAGVLYDGPTAWTSDTVFLRSDVTSEDVRILLI